MNPRICICCGEPMAQNDHGMSRNPNVCASCSSMADGMGGNTKSCADGESELDSSPDAETVASSPDPPLQQIVIEWSSGRMLKRE